MVNNGKKAISIYIDNSFSMNARSGDVPLVELAKRKAEEIASAYSPDDEFQLLSNDFEGKQQRLVNRDQFKQFLEEVKPSPASRTISQVISREKESLARSQATQKYIYIISDFQKSTSDLQNIPVDSNTKIYFIPLKSSAQKNVTVDSCWLEAPVQIVNQPAKLHVKITNYGDEDIADERITLRINDEIKTIADLNLAANSSTEDTLVFNITQSGWNKGELQVSDFPVSFDDSYFFSFNVKQLAAVLVVNGTSSNVFLDGLFSNSGLFTTTSSSLNQLDYALLKSYDCIILNQPNSISSGLKDALKQYIQNSGNLLLVPDPNNNLQSINDFLLSMNADQLQQWLKQSRQVTTINTNMNVFADVFGKLTSNIALPKTSGFFVLTQRTQSPAEELMKFNDGNSLFTRYSIGKGNFYLSSVPFDKSITDFPLNPVFAPLLFKVVVLKNNNPALSYTIGDATTFEAENFGAGKKEIYHMKGSTREFIPAQRPLGHAVMVSFGNEISEAGFYNLYLPDTANHYWLGFNFNRKESNLTILNSDEINNQATRIKAKVVSNADADLSAVISEMNRGIALWKYCIMLALLFIAIEILLLRLLK
ncbi:MAG: VWA domain-containing protein [Sphingobacteriales bacterium]|nr:MAG: VWA domain-containing protein [Sphingobacteriales bacterium]